MENRINYFQFNIFKEINKGCIGFYMMISPTSIYHILSLTLNGAEGNTKTQMINALGHENLNDLNQNNKLLIIFNNQ